MLALICLSVSMLPASYIGYGIYEEYVATRSELNGSRLLNSLATLAHLAFQGNGGISQDIQKAQKEAVAEALKLSDILLSDTGDLQRKNARGKILLSSETLMSLQTVRDKGSLLKEICSFVSARSGIGTDPHSDAASLADACADILPKIYSGYFDLYRLVEEWSYTGKGLGEISYTAANLKDDSKDLILTLKKVGSNPESINYSAVLGGLNQFNVSSEDLDATLGVIWRDEDIDTQKVKSHLLLSERFAEDIWSASAQALEETFILRIENIKENAIRISAIYASVIAAAILLTLLITWVVKSSLRNTHALLKLAHGGMLSEVAEAYAEKSLGCRDELASIDELITSVVGKFYKTLAGVKRLALASEEIEMAADSFSKRQRPHFESMDTAISQIQGNNATEASRFDSACAILGDLRKTMVRMGDEIASHADSLGRQSQKIASETDASKSFAESMTGVRGMAEKLELISKTYSEIAERANLLALNLSIEAERAGLKGSGISALVEQVRAMSVRTSVSILDIDAVRGSIESKLGDASEAAKRFSDSSQSRRIVLESMSSALEKLSDRLRRLSESGSGNAAFSSSREDISLALAALKSNMEGSNSALVEFAVSTKKSLDEFAGVMDSISFYQ